MRIRGHAFSSRLIVSALLVAALFCACTDSKTDAGRESAAQPQAAQTTEAAGADPRAAFESSGLLSGLNVDIQTVRILMESRGLPRSGVALGYGSSITSAVLAIAEGERVGGSGAPRLEKLVSASGTSGTVLPGPSIALAVSGESTVVSCALPGGRGELIGFRQGELASGFVESWRRGDEARSLIIPIPGGRIAAGGDECPVSVHDAADGREIWRFELPDPVVDIAYAPGFILAATSEAVYAFEESAGKNAWTAPLESKSASLSAGSGIAAVMTRDGRLETFVLADGSRLSSSAGPFDPGVRPVIDAGRIFVAIPGGGACELELKAGTSVRTWTWKGQSSFLAADAKNLYAGISGIRGPRIIIAPRSGSGETRELPLDAAPFDAPSAAHGSRGGLILLLRDGSVVLATAELQRAAGKSALDEAASAPEPAASSILTALGRFRARNASDLASAYLRFDLFVSGMPVDPSVAFTVFKYESQASGVKSFTAEPASTGIVLAVYDDQGVELEANIDDLGSRMRVDVKMQKGKTYWIAAGRGAGAEEARFRLYSK